MDKYSQMVTHTWNNNRESLAYNINSVSCLAKAIVEIEVTISDTFWNLS